MTALLVLATFAVFLLIDYVHSRRPAVAEAGAAPDVSAVRRLQTAYAGGFEVRPNVRYHPGHTWALGESPNFVRVGMDDFAARLIGKMDSISMPKRGQWVRQGQKLVTVAKNGKQVELVSPIEGEVTGLNEAILKDPLLAVRDPYGEGWLVTVQSPDTRTNFRNLLTGSLARRWMEEASSRLRSRLATPAYSGALAQDGGLVVENVAEHLSGDAWTSLMREFFLT